MVHTRAKSATNHWVLSKSKGPEEVREASDPRTSKKPTAKEGSSKGKTTLPVGNKSASQRENSADQGNCSGNK